MDDTALKQRGAALKRDIEAEYARLKSTNTLMQPWKGHNDITDIAVKYIPAGTSFADGEAILRSAGFQVALPQTDSVPHPALDIHDDLTGILRLEESFPSVVETGISLSPSVAGDYGIVGRVTAGISVSSL